MARIIVIDDNDAARVGGWPTMRPSRTAGVAACRGPLRRREVLRAGLAGFAGLSLPGQTLEWLNNLLEPIRAARERVEGLVRRAEELKGELETKAA